jgi:hypothetical protein
MPSAARWDEFRSLQSAAGFKLDNSDSRAYRFD